MNNPQEAPVTTNTILPSQTRAATTPVVKFFDKQSEYPLAVIAQSDYEVELFVDESKLKKLLIQQSHDGSGNGVHKMACKVSQYDLDGCNIKFSIANPKHFITGDGHDNTNSALVSKIAIGNITKEHVTIIDMIVERSLSGDSLEVVVYYTRYPSGRYGASEYLYELVAIVKYSLSDELTSNSEPFFIDTEMGDSVSNISADAFANIDMSYLLEYQNKIITGEVADVSTFYTQLKNPKTELVS